MTRFLTVLAILLLPCAAEAVPVAHGQVSAHVLPRLDWTAPNLELSFSEESSTTTIFTRGTGEAEANAEFSGVSGFARVNGPVGRAVAEGIGQALLTITNTGTEAVLIDPVLGINFSGLLGEPGDELPIPGPAALIDDPAREFASWYSILYVSESADCPVNSPEEGGCFLAYHALGAGPNYSLDPDEAYSAPFFFGELGTGDSVSFWLTAYFRAEAVRVPEPGSLAILLVGLGGLLGVRRVHSAAVR